MFVPVIVLAILLSFSIGAQAAPKEDAQAIFERFLSLFAASNAEEITDLFANDALFWGATSRDLVTTHEGVRKYFDNSFGTPPRPAVVKTSSRGTTALVVNDSSVLVSGMWQFERTIDGKTISSPQLHFNLIVNKRGDRWLITQFLNTPGPTPPIAVTK